MSFFKLNSSYNGYYIKKNKDKNIQLEVSSIIFESEVA